MNLTTAQQAQNPLRGVLVERPQKEIPLPNFTGAIRSAVNTGESGLKTLGRFVFFVAGALARIIVFSEADSPALGYKTSTRNGSTKNGQTEWNYDWRLYTQVARR